MIIGLTDDSVVPGFPRLGKLRKGSEKKKVDGKEQSGDDLDHFRFTSDREDVMEAYKNLFIEKPSVFQFFFPFATVEENFPTWKEKYGGATLYHRCDGVNTVSHYLNEKYIVDPEKQIPCPGGCKEIGKLIMILPPLWNAGFIGYVVMETHSINDLLNIVRVLKKTYEERVEKNFDLRGVEFTLRRVIDQISTPGWGNNKGKRVRTLKYMCRVEPSVDWARLALAATMESEPAMIGAGVNNSAEPVEESEPIDVEVVEEFKELIKDEVIEEPEPIKAEAVEAEYVFKPTKAMVKIKDELKAVFKELIEINPGQFQPVLDRFKDSYESGWIEFGEERKKLTLQHLKDDLKRGKEFLDLSKKNTEVSIEDVRRQVLEAIGSDLVAAAAIKTMPDVELLAKAGELGIKINESG